MARVTSIHQARPTQALDNLNRLTGLRFNHWPESLLERSTTKKTGHEGRHQARKSASAD